MHLSIWLFWFSVEISILHIVSLRFIPTVIPAAVVRLKLLPILLCAICSSPARKMPIISPQLEIVLSLLVVMLSVRILHFLKAQMGRILGFPAREEPLRRKILPAFRDVKKARFYECNMVIHLEPVWKRKS
jgi:hypothetical protein